MPPLTKTVHVSTLPRQFRQGREDGFVTVTIEEAEAASDEEKLAHLRAEIEEGDRDIAEGRVSPAEEVFARLRAALPEHEID